MNGSTRIRNVVFSLATALSLGFGAAQAFATPGAAPQATADTCSGAEWSFCLNRCRSQGYISGSCEKYNGYALCDCYGIQPYGS